MQRDIKKVLISQYQIMGRVKELAEQITRDHIPSRRKAEAEVTILPILTGALVFAGDLIRQIPMPIKIGLMTVSSYPGASLRTQGSKIVSKQLQHVEGRHVLIVDDILDSGGTLRLVAPAIKKMGAASVKTCVLLRKDRKEAKDFAADYVGFEIPDEFVVGYGLDYNGYYRNLPDIVTLTDEAIAKRKE